MNRINIFLMFSIFFRLNSTAADFSDGKSSFHVKLKNEEWPYKIFSAFVMPSEEVTLECFAPKDHVTFVLEANHGKIIHFTSNKFQWQAPADKGFYQLHILRQDYADTVSVNVFVMVPATALKGEYLNQYRMGHYPKIARRNLDIYRPPKGFVEVTEQTRHLKISPHFTLGQFICKQTGGFPKYIVLRPKLILKLELLLEKVNENGYACSTFAILSGYRTPYYNHAIGNVKYSRHVYGGAADIFIDQHPKDGMMDDLNGDKAINWKDAKIMYDLIDRLYGQTFYEKFIGGLGRYKKTANHGPFVHVDVRGFRARWGD